MNNRAVSKVLIGIVLTILWILCFLYIPSPAKIVAIILGLVVIFFYHQLYSSPVEVTKLSWTCVLTVSWLALILFFPFKTSGGAGGAVGFFALIGGLAVSVLWIRFFSDEIVLE